MFEMPHGRYLTCAISVSPDYGGQTRAHLMRNRILATEAGLRPSVLAFGAAPDYDERREILLDRKLLIPEVELLNIFEHYRLHGWGEEPSSKVPPEDLSAHKTMEQFLPDGSPWRITYHSRASSDRPIYDYLRPDGTPYLRIPGFAIREPQTWPQRIERIGPDGNIVGEFGSLAQWYKRWVRELTVEDERAFVFMDTRNLVPHLVPMKAPRIHLIYLLHNVHVRAPRHWNSPINEVYQRMFGRIGGMDAMVTLTDRQREDIARRHGRTSNMYVVPNPVDLPPPPATAPPRDPHQVTIVARLERQKRLHQAIAVFDRVVQAVPAAKLDIFGEGSQRERLQTEIDQRGLNDSVRLRGYDSNARDALWTSSAFLMTSSFEGYPLSTLESMSHGCPVVSYDIKYGPREQISDGIDGFVVPSRDVAAAAERVIELLRSPQLVEKMSAAAIEKAKHHGREAFLRDWSEVLHQAMERKPFRTDLESVTLELKRLRVVPAQRGRRLLAGNQDFVSGGARATDALEISGRLTVDGRSRRSSLDAARLSLNAVHSESGEVVELPLRVEREGNKLGFSSVTPLENLFRAESPEAGARSDVVQIRLRLVWENSAWETVLTRPAGSQSEIEVSYSPDEVLQLTRQR